MARKMKDSGIEWIGEIPEEWEVVKINGLYKLRTTKVDDSEYPPLSVTKNGIVPQLESAAKTNDHANRKLVKKGDFVINSRSDRKGSCGISPYDGSVSLINTVLEPMGEMEPEYYNWLFNTSLFAEEFYKWGSGIVDDLWTTNWNDMKRMTVPLPTLDIQRKIAKHLYDIVGNLDFVTRLITQEIETLETYKKSIITEAVTKGLEKSVKMKDSGIEWIGEIPDHWELIPLKYLANYNENTLNDTTPGDFEFEYIDIGSVEYGKGIQSLETMTFRHAPSRARRVVIPGDIIISTVRTYLKAIAIIPQNDKPLIVSTGFTVIRSNSNVEQEFLSYAIQCETFISKVVSRSTGVSYPAISSTELMQIPVIVPDESERIKIVRYLDQQCSTIDEMIRTKQRQLRTLDEYKKSIIYEYVTGKKEVPYA